MEDLEPTNKYRQQLNRDYAAVYEANAQMLRTKGLDNLYLFNKYVLRAQEGDSNFVPLAPFHKEVCNFVQDRADRRKLVLIPRSHLKSKLITIGRSTQKIIQNPKIRILIYSATWQIATDLQMAIQKNLKSER